MKNVVIIGNCQCGPVAQMLNNSKKFIKKYSLKQYSPIHLITAEEVAILHEDIQRADVLITQPISEDFRPRLQVSTEKLQSFLPVHGKSIIFPALYWSGYTPEFFTYKSFDGVIQSPIPQNIFVLWGYSEKKSPTEIIAQINNAPLSAYYKEHAQAAIAELRRREKEWKLDVTISEYLEKNYRKLRLFFDPMHPSDYILQHCADQILNHLDASPPFWRKAKVSKTNQAFSCNALPISSAVYNSLDLKFVCPAQPVLSGLSVTMEEYIERLFVYYDEHKEFVEHNKNLLAPLWKNIHP